MKFGGRWLWFGGAMIPYAALGLIQTPAPTFDEAVLPIFKAHCFTCHSGKGASGGLDLSTGAGFKKGGGSGPAFVAGKPESSLILSRILGNDGLPRMPMGFQPLAAADVEKIRAWIKSGASFSTAKPKTHWAYVAPVRPKVPAVAPASWVKNPIDAFILAKLRSQKIAPAKPAAKETLLRRVYLDLIGIPPSPKEIDAFLADRAPNAYEKVVDRLLANPHYGERMARPWLDLARYADSDGYEKDLNRTAWLYRDWVIDAFNRNMPYSEFTIEQLAGDLLPNSTAEQKVATGFSRNTMFNQEGGVDQEEAYFNVILDRVGTTSTVFLGSTIQCARCHDHKYDPFSQRDFYELYAYFNNGVVLPRGPKEVGEEKWFEPEIKVPTADQLKKERSWEKELAVAKAELSAKSKALDPEFQKWLENARPSIWATVKPAGVTVTSGEAATVAADGTISLFTKTPRFNYEIAIDLQPGTYRGVRIETVPDPQLSRGGAGNADGGNFVMSRATAKFQDREKPFLVANADFVQEEFTAAGVLDDNVDTGWAVYPMPNQPHQLGLAWKSPIVLDHPDKLVLKLEFNSNRWPQHTLAKFRVALTGAEGPEQYIYPADVSAALTAANRTSAQQQRLRSYFDSISPTLREFRERVASLQSKLNALRNEIPTALVLQDKPSSGPLYAYVHTRGEFLNKADKVQASTPAVFGPLPPNSPSSRLGLARWIVDHKNPLTARVAVNRLWEQCFGRGIVETSEDFGTQGSRPSHPELLDWLAVEFMDSNWNVKRLMRLIVTSNTYRLSSIASPASVEKDPQNIYLGRAPRFRMEAEMIRDAVLSAGGLLSNKMGGPSVYPSQPEGVWNTPYSGESWMTSQGEDRYRRGIYTFIKRTSPYPSFLAFDATSREACTVRRVRTNTPLQALAMMNDRVVLDAAMGVAKRVATEATANDQSRLVYAFRLCTGRRPQASELAVLTKLLSNMRVKYRAMPQEAKKLGSSPENAAWTMVASVLLNLDETITKE